MMEEGMIFFFRNVFYHYLGSLFKFSPLLWFCLLTITCSHNQTLTCPSVYFKELILLQNQIVDIAGCLSPPNQGV